MGAPDIAERVARWRLACKRKLPPPLPAAGPHLSAIIVAAAPLLAEAATPAPGGGGLLLRLWPRAGVRLPDVWINPEPGSWRCTQCEAGGGGLLSLVAWARDCSLSDAWAWLYVIRRAGSADYSTHRARECS